MRYFDIDTHLVKPKSLKISTMAKKDRAENAKHWLIIIGTSAIIVFALLGLV